MSSCCSPLSSRVCLTIRETCGPLFVIEEVTDTDVVAALQRHCPQLLKKHHGWKLSIEELRFLQYWSQSSVTNLPCPFSITVADKKALELMDSLATLTERACVVYRVLTLEHGLRLRHGSQFGALFIGYKDVATHGDILFFLGPLSPLEEVRAARVAGSVGKRAEVVLVQEDTEGGPTVVRQPVLLTGNRSSTGAQQPRKKHRKN